MNSENLQQFFNAVKAGDRGKVRELLGQDAGLINARNEANISAILLAMYCRQTELAYELSELKELDIFEAAAMGKTVRVKQLLDQNPSLANEFSPDGFPVLGYAAFFGHLETLRALLEAGANPNHQARNTLKVCPIHSALANGDEAIALAMTELLLAKGATPNISQQAGYTPMHEAAARGSVTLINLLLRYGADSTAKNDEGKTPLDLAIEKGRPEAVALLQALL